MHEEEELGWIVVWNKALSESKIMFKLFNPGKFKNPMGYMEALLLVFGRTKMASSTKKIEMNYVHTMGVHNTLVMEHTREHKICPPTTM